MPGKVPTTSGKSSKLKTIDLTRDIKIVRTRSDFDKFITLQRESATSETLDDINALIDAVVHSRDSGVNRTKPINDSVRKSITVPPTVLQRDETPPREKFKILPKYIRFMQNRESVNGIRLNNKTRIHYNPFVEDFNFIQSFNEKSTELTLEVDEFLMLMDIFEKATAKCNSNQISYDLALNVARENSIPVQAPILREVHRHWINRRSEYGRPLVRHLWPQTNPTDASPLALFRPRAKEKMLLRKPRKTYVENLQYMFHLIDGFKRVLKILAKMRQRDEKKLVLAELEVILWDQRRNESIDVTYTCPFWECVMDNKKHKSTKKKKTLQKPPEEKPTLPRLQSVQNETVTIDSIDLPNTQDYKRMRISRRMGRGGRLWIDRRILYHEQKCRDNVSALSTDCETELVVNQQLDTALNVTKFNNFDIYNNEVPLNQFASFANPYEAGHVYNTMGLNVYSMPGYIQRQLQVLDILDNVTVGESFKGSQKSDNS